MKTIEKILNQIGLRGCDQPKCKDGQFMEKIKGRYYCTAQKRVCFYFGKKQNGMNSCEYLKYEEYL